MSAVVANDMPIGWGLRKLGDCMRLINGRAYSQHELLDEGTPIIRIQNLNGGDRWYFSNLDLPEDKYCSRGDLLFAWSASFGPYIWNGERSIYHYHIWRIVPFDNIDKQFAFHLLEWITERVKAASHGVAMLHMTKAGMEAWEIPLPPLEQQRRIAAILDQAETLRTQRRQALTHLDTLTQSVFLDMFGDPVANPKGFQTKGLGEVATFYGGNSLPSGSEYSDQVGGYFLMKVSDMNLLGNEREIHRCQNWSEVAGSKASTCPVGSIIVPKRGGAIGTNKKRITTRRTVLDPNLMAICPAPNQLNQEFLFQWFLGFDLASIASGSSVPQLNKQDLEPLSTLVPPLPLQQTFAARIQAIEALKSTHRTALTQLDALFASLQQQAFAGEL